jgi:V8-like Glu-specific endopeptidase
MSSNQTNDAGRNQTFWGERTLPESLEALAQRGPKEGQSCPRTFVSEVDKARNLRIDDRSEPTTVRASRHGGDFCRYGINPEVGYTGYRPPGVDLVYKPRVALQTRREPWQRMNGGRDSPADLRKSHLLDDTRYPWGCIARISTDRGTGSGALVGRNLAVTAAHVIPWDLNRPIFFDTNHAALTRTMPRTRTSGERSGGEFSA